VRTWILAMAILMVAGSAAAASRDVQYGPRPAWVVPPPAPTTTPTPEGAPGRVIYFDQQIHVGAGENETYVAYRLKILTPQMLTAGNLKAMWNPGTDDLIIHELKILRGDQVIDVLATSKFQVIEREDKLDYAVFDGDLTAALQAPGLQIGDELEVAMTIRRRDATFGGRSYGFAQLPVAGAPGAYRLRLTWLQGQTVQWRSTPDLGALADKVSPGDGKASQHELTVELRDPVSAIATDGAPSRFNMRRDVEYSQFSSWAELSNALWPLFDKAEALAPDSPLRLEATKIASATSDPAARAEAAL
jgi:hypothetical protein